jgi:hypothetical protein
VDRRSFVDGPEPAQRQGGHGTEVTASGMRDCG